MQTGATSETSFRTATAQDIDVLRQFERGIVSTEGAFDTTLKAGPIHYYDIERMLRADNVRFVIAEHGTIVVGCGFARIDDAKTCLSHSHQAYLGLVYVEPHVATVAAPPSVSCC